MNTIIKNLKILFVLGIFFSGSTGASESVHLEKSPNELCDQGSLQRGAALYVNFCQGCHALQYLRYKGVAHDLGIVDDKGQVLEALVKKNLNFVSDNINDSMVSSMHADKAKKWFGVPPPDLSLVARVRGTDWIYSYLRAFYIDETKPWGVNNTVFPSVAMPHVLVDLQGEQHLTQDKHLQLVTAGKLSTQEYDKVVVDLVNFLDYVGEPVKLKRQKIGVGVMVFLVIFLVFAFLLKREYWKDVK